MESNRLIKALEIDTQKINCSTVLSVASNYVTSHPFIYETSQQSLCRLKPIHILLDNLDKRAVLLETQR